MEATAQPLYKFCVEGYLQRERGAEFRSEYVDGGIYAKGGENWKHNVIAMNLIAGFGSQLKGTPFVTLASDQKTRAGNNLFAYPDLMVVCEEMRFHDAEKDVLTNPTILVEVLSSSTERYDRTTKWERYQQIETLRDYVLVAQNTPRVEHYFRDEDGQWTSQVLTGLDAALTLTGAPVALTLARIHARIPFDAA